MILLAKVFAPLLGTKMPVMVTGCVTQSTQGAWPAKSDSQTLYCSAIAVFDQMPLYLQADRTVLVPPTAVNDFPCEAETCWTI